jgi:hypothetical protein
MRVVGRFILVGGGGTTTEVDAVSSNSNFETNETSFQGYVTGGPHIVLIVNYLLSIKSSAGCAKF